jgi:hypothetical protein
MAESKDLLWPFTRFGMTLDEAKGLKRSLEMGRNEGVYSPAGTEMIEILEKSIEKFENKQTHNETNNQ